ncbi:hypothetical protein [Iodobacter ciconiae]|uniref:Uncharacterized protein n=1 Tax=Iodobacter ciconiae TaxID=2496266 RepID=A0A3S8ZPT7_9NEIS|nr:hypothetical protein [Iodobacter ciconiae]AZN35484.1 hypothetical protein EJO50_02665 [Iodobacter ciconiae]
MKETLYQSAEGLFFKSDAAPDDNELARIVSGESFEKWRLRLFGNNGVTVHFLQCSFVAPAWSRSDKHISKWARELTDSIDVLEFVRNNYFDEINKLLLEKYKLVNEFSSGKLVFPIWTAHYYGPSIGIDFFNGKFCQWFQPLLSSALKEKERIELEFRMLTGLDLENYATLNVTDLVDSINGILCLMDELADDDSVESRRLLEQEFNNAFEDEELAFKLGLAYVIDADEIEQIIYGEVFIPNLEGTFSSEMIDVLAGHPVFGREFELVKAWSAVVNYIASFGLNIDSLEDLNTLFEQGLNP